VDFDTKRLPAAGDGVAPDGSDVRILLGLERGSMAHFEMGRGQTSAAVAHRTVEEIWYVLKGRGEMWRKQGDREETVAMEPGVCLSIPVGTRFQFRCLGDEPLAVIGTTMPPWPGAGEADEVDGIWPPKR
jgi:mannose-6-phosphate isomerase-like protein (cupin superfamily)